MNYQKFKHFSRQEKWGDPDAMKESILYELDKLRDYVGLPVVIRCGWENRTSGYHPFGTAVDMHIEGMPPIDQFIAASRFGFRGIGVYPWWSSPGLHLDMGSRDGQKHKALWGSPEKGKYVKLNTGFITDMSRSECWEQICKQCLPDSIEGPNCAYKAGQESIIKLIKETSSDCLSQDEMQEILIKKIRRL